MKSKIKGFLVALMYMAIGFSVQIIVSIIGGIIIAVSYTVKQGADSLTGAGKEDTTVMIAKQIMGNMNYILLASSITTILIFMLIYKLRKKKLSEELRFKKTKASNYWVALLLGVSVYLFNIGFISLLSKAGLFKGSFDALEKNMSFIGESNIFLTILVVGIVAPFAEELLFRGIIYKTLSKSMSIPAVIIIQGVLFGVYHMILVQAIYATLLGILFGYVTYKTKSLWPAIIMHMVNNTVSTIASSILGESLETVFSLIIVLSLGFAITAVGTFLIKKNNPKIIEDTKVGIEV
ncbi:CPBP family intramembrane glutamic endopeptidase [Clostridium gasigenes]|uniref:CPBP family intramembrane glutamic endopeptidase n=1 Tax=Clostridium gasigenes TaxID=94869 RepID=UPI001C0B3864|nr:CPBP family intramembrane glutamic endopeptidase [Clostridium gasigenes]MBU3103128.1 CPBP family intramembrane metalloprotease [Clostridium gasigenes]